MKTTLAVLTILAGISVTACAQMTLTQRVTQQVKDAQKKESSSALVRLDPSPAPADYTFLFRNEYPDGQPSKVAAPQAKLFHFAAEFKESNNRFDARPITQTLQKIQQLNKKLLPKNKIRVVSISRGFSEEDGGAEDFARACRELEASGVLVLTTNDVFTLSRAHAAANPDDASAYQRPAYWFLPREYALYGSFDNPLVPTDFRTTASPTGNSDYVLYANGGLSWAVPYLAGLYALSVQVNPSVTPAQFREAVLKTARQQKGEFAGEKFQAKTLINPAALIEAVRGLNK